MTHPDGGNRYAAIGKIAFFACLVLAALAALWFSLTSGGGDTFSYYIIVEERSLSALWRTYSGWFRADNPSSFTCR